jgi:diaminopimelate decarboxylase
VIPGERGPRFVYDEAQLYEAFTGIRGTVRESFPAGQVAYAVKCNPLPQIVRSLAAWGCWFEVAWPREVSLVLDASADPGHLIWGGAHRSPGLYRAAADLSVLLTVESLGQLREALAVTGLRICLRVRVLSVSRFGLPAEQVPEAAALLAASGRTEAALQVHNSGGEWPPKPDSWRLRAEILAEAAEHLARAGVAVPLVSLGGGLPEPDTSRPDREEFAAACRPLLLAAADVLASRLPGMTVIVEPGRGLVQHCGSFYTRVTDVRAEGNGTRAAVLESGVCTLASLTSSTGTSVLAGPAAGRAAGPVSDIELLGPSNREDDRLGMLTGPLPRIGDVVKFDRVGAYQQAFRNGFAEEPVGVDWIPRPAGGHDA